MSLIRFINRIKSFTIFKDHPLGATDKDLDLFIETRDFLKIERAITDNFPIVRCFYHKTFKQGTKKRYVVYSEGRFLLIDLGINAWYIRDNCVMTHEQMSYLTIDQQDIKVLKPELVSDLEKIYKKIPMSPGFGFVWFYKLIKRVFHNEGRIIALIGPDGSGKTTIANELEKRLRVAFNVDRRYFGWGNFTPLMNTIYIAYKPKNKQVTAIGWRHFIAYYAEMLLRYWSLWFKKRFLGRIIILDRYFYDKLSSIPINTYKHRLFESITPRPDYLFLLKASPENIINRKKELDKTQIKVLYIRYEDCFKPMIIDANKKINQVARSIIEEINNDLINNKVVLE